MIIAVINIFVLKQIQSEASSVPGGQTARPSTARPAVTEQPTAPAASPAAAV